MRWVGVMEALLAELKAKPALAGVPFKRHEEFAGYVSPLVKWSRYFDGLEENINVIRVQFDIYAREIDEALAMEGAIRELHRDAVQTIGGIPMLIEGMDASDRPDPEAGVDHHLLDLRITVAREGALTW